MKQAPEKRPADTEAPAAVVECCLNCGFGKAVTSHVERCCTCPGGPREGKLVSPRFRCGGYRRWRPGFSTAGAKRWGVPGARSGQHGSMDD